MNEVTEKNKPRTIAQINLHYKINIDAKLLRIKSLNIILVILVAHHLIFTNNK